MDLRPWSVKTTGPNSEIARNLGNERRQKFHSMLSFDKRNQLNAEDSLKMIDGLNSIMDDSYSTYGSNWAQRLRTDPVGQYIMDDWLPHVTKQRNLKFGVNRTPREVLEIKRAFIQQNLKGLRESIEPRALEQKWDPVESLQTYDDEVRSHSTNISSIEKKLAAHQQTKGQGDQEGWVAQNKTLTFSLEQAKAARINSLRKKQKTLYRRPDNRIVTITRGEMAARFSPSSFTRANDLFEHIESLRDMPSDEFDQNLSFYISSIPEGSDTYTPAKIGALYHFMANASEQTFTPLAIGLGLLPQQALEESDNKLHNYFDLKNLPYGTKEALALAVGKEMNSYVNDITDRFADNKVKDQINNALYSLILYRSQASGEASNIGQISNIANELASELFPNSVKVETTNSSFVVSQNNLDAKYKNLSKDAVRKDFSDFGSMFQDLKLFDKFFSGNSYERQFNFFKAIDPSFEVPENAHTPEGVNSVVNITSNLGWDNHPALKSQTNSQTFFLKNKPIRFIEFTPEQYEGLSKENKEMVKWMTQDEHVMTAVVSQLMGNYKLNNSLGGKPFSTMETSEFEQALSSLGLSDTSTAKNIYKKIQGSVSGAKTTALAQELDLKINNQILSEHVRLTRHGDGYAFTFFRPDNNLPQHKVYLKNANDEDLIFTGDEIMGLMGAVRSYQKRMKEIINRSALKPITAPYEDLENVEYDVSQ
jgi:hypothetical protein